MLPVLVHDERHANARPTGFQQIIDVIVKRFVKNKIRIRHLSPQKRNHLFHQIAAGKGNAEQTYHFPLVPETMRK